MTYQDTEYKLYRDLNAQVGREMIYRLTIGNESVYDKNYENGKRLIEFAIANEFTVSCSSFFKENIAWIALNGIYKS